MRRWALFLSWLAAGCGLMVSRYEEDHPIPPGTNAIIQGTAIDLTSEAPAPNVRIEFRGLGDRYRPPDAVVVTNENGEFQFRGSTGEYLIIPEAPYGSCVPRVLILEDTDPILLLRLVPGGTLQGQVTDHQGNAMGGVQVHFREIQPYRIGSPHWEGTTETGPDGVYAITGVPPDRQLSVDMGPEWVVEPVGGSSRIQVRAGRSQDLDLIARRR